MVQHQAKTLNYPISICCDNQAAIKISISEELPFKKSKFIDLKFHVVRDRIQNNQIELTYVSSRKNTANYLTNVLPKEIFESHTDGISLESFKYLEQVSLEDEVEDELNDGE